MQPLLSVKLSPTMSLSLSKSLSLSPSLPLIFNEVHFISPIVTVAAKFTLICLCHYHFHRHPQSHRHCQYHAKGSHFHCHGHKLSLSLSRVKDDGTVIDNVTVNDYATIPVPVLWIIPAR